VPRSMVIAYLITWSACSKRVCGILSPSALAVLRLITNSNLVGCSIDHGRRHRYYARS
jgi:hypothetical protein